MFNEYLSKKTACLCAEPENFVRRCGNQQVFSGSRSKADLQCRIKMRALHIENTHIDMEQLDRDKKKKKEVRK